MAGPDWLRTFVAVFRSGSVTDGARLRGLSQPAASQQLAGLERVVGAALFVRRSDGVVPTARGRELYAQVASPLDQLETVLVGLEAGRFEPGAQVLRFGSSAEYFAAQVVPRLSGTRVDLVARFGEDRELLGCLEEGEVDLAVTSTAPPRRAVDATVVGDKRFVLVAAPSLAAGVHFGSLDHLGEWLAGHSWAAYSLELPITRRFWQRHLGRPFSARLRLVAPDLRAVLGAVERGVGCSILPEFICANSMAQGRIVELHPVSSLITSQAWYLCTRQGEAGRAPVASMVELLASPVLGH